MIWLEISFTLLHAPSEGEARQKLGAAGPPHAATLTRFDRELLFNFEVIASEGKACGALPAPANSTDLIGAVLEQYPHVTHVKRNVEALEEGKEGGQGRRARRRRRRTWSS